MKDVAGCCTSTLETLTALALSQRRNQQNVCRDDSKPDIKILKISVCTPENTTPLLQRPAVQSSARRKSAKFPDCHKRHIHD